MLNQSVRTFLTVAECGSFNKAADKLYITPTAVMKQVTSMERRLGFDLFVRTHGGVTLTRAGMSLRRDAMAVVALSDDATKRAASLASPSEDVVRIGSSQLYPASRAMRLWDAVGSRLPNMVLSIVHFEEDASDNYVTHVGTSCDIIYAAFDRADVTSGLGREFLEVERTPFFVAVPRWHPLASRECVAPADLAGLTVMMMASGVSPENDRVRSLIRAEAPSATFEDVDSNYHLGHFNICAESGVPLVSLGIWVDVHPGLVHVPLDFEASVPCGFLFPTDASPATEKFIGVMRDWRAASLSSTEGRTAGV